MVRCRLFFQMAVRWVLNHLSVKLFLGRPVWTHEFAFRDELVKEYLGVKETPSFEDILNLIPQEKRL